MTRLPSNLPEILRARGLKVVEIAGWQTRGRPASSGPFGPVGILCHHTATSKAWSDQKVINLLVGGRSDLPGPLVQLGLGRDGTVYVIASGRANHAGKAKASGSMPAGDGNTMYVGIEAFNDGVGEPWPKIQRDAYVMLCATLALDVIHCTADHVRAHRETSVTGKVDPKGIDMTDHRLAVAKKMSALAAPAGPLTRGPVIDAELERLSKAKPSAANAPKVKAAIDALRSIKPWRKTR